MVVMVDIVGLGAILLYGDWRPKDGGGVGVRCSGTICAGRTILVTGGGAAIIGGVNILGNGCIIL